MSCHAQRVDRFSRLPQVVIMQRHLAPHGPVSCSRCGGLLRIEQVRRSRVQLLACTACGDRTDETILANRRCMARQEPHDWKASMWDRIRMLASLEQVAA